MNDDYKDPELDNHFNERHFSISNWPPQSTMKLFHNRSKLKVIKHGRTTGWTAGILNTLLSDSRMIGSDVPYRGYMVHDLPTPVGHPWHFSDKGDSGSIVFSFDGKMVGMLNGGCDDAPFRTITTPIEFICLHLEDLVRMEGLAPPNVSPG
jgi:hypothetical protein